MTNKQATPAVQPPSEFNFNKPETWPMWIKRFERYVADLTKKPDKEKINLLCYIMGEKSEEILNQVLLKMTDSTTFKTVKINSTPTFLQKRILSLKGSSLIPVCSNQMKTLTHLLQRYTH